MEPEPETTWSEKEDDAVATRNDARSLDAKRSSDNARKMRLRR